MNSRERDLLDRHITGNYGEDQFRDDEEDSTTTWVYLHTEPGVFTVGFYESLGTWHTDSNHESRDEAAARVHYLNGGKEN